MKDKIEVEFFDWGFRTVTPKPKRKKLKPNNHATRQRKKSKNNK